MAENNNAPSNPNPHPHPHANRPHRGNPHYRNSSNRGRNVEYRPNYTDEEIRPNYRKAQNLFGVRDLREFLDKKHEENVSSRTVI